MRNEWAFVGEMSTRHAFSEINGGCLTANDPCAGLNDSTLDNWKLFILLVNRLTKFVSFIIFSKYFLSLFYEFTVARTIVTCEDTKTFSSEQRFADPFYLFRFYSFTWFIIESG